MSKEQIISSTIDAVSEVVQTMAGQEVQRGEPFEREKNANMGEITVMVGFSGPKLRGVIALHINQETALALGSSLFGISGAEINDEILDCCGEFGNMVAGCIKKFAVEKGVEDYNLTVPTITYGLNFFTRIQNENKSVVFPFAMPGLENGLNVEVKVDEQ